MPSILFVSGNSFFLDRIVAKDFDATGVPEYLCRWKGYSAGESTWETEQNILSASAIEEFENAYKDPNLADKLDKKADQVIDAMIKFQDQRTPKYGVLPAWEDRVRTI